MEYGNTPNNDLNSQKTPPNDLNFQKTPVPTPRFKKKTEVVQEGRNSLEEKQNNNNKKMQNNYKYHFNPAQNLSQDSGLSPRYDVLL